MSNLPEQNARRYPIWQLTDGTIVIQAESKDGLTDSDIRSVEPKNRQGVSQMLRHRLYSLLELI